jgi:hypothetical protein
MKQAAFSAPVPCALRALLVAAANVWLAPATAWAARSDDASFRLFLKDGTSVSSYGEFVRVGDRVVFSIQVGEAAGQPRLQLVSLEASDVDWPRTDNYSDTVRASRYASSRGDADFAQLTARVAAALEVLSTTTEPATRLQIVEQMRREVGDWPASHFGYRSRDVAQIAALLDEAVSELRAAGGSKDFDLSLMATVEPPKAPLTPPPTPAEAIEQVLGVARHLDLPAERISLLRSALAFIDDSKGAVSKSALARLRRSARRDLQEETDLELAYADLARRTLADVSMHAARGDVRGVEKAFADIAHADRRLGHRRADQVDVLMARVEQRLETARRIRLALDRWAFRVEACSQYRDQVDRAVRDLVAASAALEDIKKLAGPSLNTLHSLGPRLRAVSERLGGLTPPAELSAVQGLFQSAAELAMQAVLVRQDAVRTGDVGVAWNASSAAAGSMMLLARARGDLDAFFKPPELR